MKLFDAHCHLQPPDAFARAFAVGIEKIAVCGTSSDDWNEILKISEQYPQIFPSIGIHPWFVSSEWGKSFQTLEEMVRKVSNFGIGETGLDFSDRFKNRAEQEASFAAHLDLARELNRPVAVHCVRAWGRLIEILREHPAPRILLHAFGGAPELIPELTELNCWFSFCGVVTNPKAKKAMTSVAAVPADRLLIETDSPDFPPVGCESPNEPANLMRIAHAIAQLRGISIDEIARVTFVNSVKFFGTI